MLAEIQRRVGEWRVSKKVFLLHGQSSTRHLLELGSDGLVDLEELGDATIDADSLALVQVALNVGLGDALLVAR